MALPVEVRPVTADRLDDVADLFASNATTRGCWCMFFIATPAEFRAGLRGANRAQFEELTAASDVPVGVLAYRDETPVGWCAAGPRARYQRAIGPRATILAGRDRTADRDVWLVPCFFTRVGSRRHGVTGALLNAAVDVARNSGAVAVEGFPRAAGQRPSPDDYLGREDVFASCGFACVARPTPRRAVMRRDL
ncbi:MAG: GNAT family N-acetyltransferase [Acidimicrobiales bacterium]